MTSKENLQDKSSLNLEDVLSFASKDRIAFKKHTVLRMHGRKISAEDVKTALLSCRQIEGYPDDHPCQPDWSSDMLMIDPFMRSLQWIRLRE